MASGPTTDNTGKIVKRGPEEPQILTLLSRMKGEIARALPRHITPDRMLRVALTAMRTNPDLMQCSQASVLGSIMSAAQLGLEPNTPLGLAYLIPYKRVCQLIIGYQGYMELARRSGLVATPYAYVVRQGDIFRYSLGLNPALHHEPLDDEEREKRPMTHVYAVAHAIPRDSAPPVFVVLTRAQVYARRSRSSARSSGPWVTDEEAMWLKTAVRALWKWLPKTAEMATAAAFDEKHESGQAQVEAWDPSVIDAMKREGVVVDSPAETTPEPEKTEIPAPTKEAPPADGARPDFE